MFSRRTYEKRREVLKNKFEKGVILICGNSLSPSSYLDNTFPFIQDSTFLYYFGLNKENLMGVIDIDKDEEIIFGDELTIDDIIWSGQQLTLEDQCKLVGVENNFSYEEAGKYIKDARNSGREIHFVNQYLPDNILRISEWLDIKPK
ncbi:aminopeptidase P N-terminal domain-containing protein [Fusobacterium sp.]|nr:aminopeptidase P N-terminal domain-containing protein [Fusobacterium sp.]